MTYSVAVSGASGYAGGEILRLLADHPDFDVRTVTAHSNAGQPLVAVQPHLRTYTHLTLKETSAETLAGHDVVFLALPHGASGAIAAELSDETLVVDQPARPTAALRDPSIAAGTPIEPQRGTHRNRSQLHRSVHEAAGSPRATHRSRT
jgi:uncharacterized protein YbjT (DUF2867 family)